jgi:hypothetical protein
MLCAIARLGERGEVRVLDGGNRFNAYIVARAASGRPEVLNRITVSRAFTCYQVHSLLESTPAVSVPFVVLDLLNTFYDESVGATERKRLLGACIVQLERLAGTLPSVAEAPCGMGGSAPAGDSLPVGTSVLLSAGTPGLEVFSEQGLSRAIRLETTGVVSVHPPKVASPAATELLEQLQSLAADTYYLCAEAPASEPVRLF